MEKKKTGKKNESRNPEKLLEEIIRSNKKTLEYLATR